MKAFLRLLVGLCPDREQSVGCRPLSALSYQRSVVSRSVRTIQVLIVRAYNLTPERSAYGRSLQGLIPKTYYLIPFFIFVFVSYNAAMAQEPSTAPAAEAVSGTIDLVAQGIQIGERAPDITITNIHNYISSTAKLSDFEGKILILDFWATWCSPCVAMIPTMDSLQREFGDKVQFLSVTYQSEEEVLPFLKNLERRNDRRYDLPVVVGDSLLKKEFPHKYLPHYVWIDGDGIVKGITSFEDVNAANIIKLYTGGALDLKEKHDMVAVNYDWTQPLLTTDSGSSVFFSYSIASAFQNGFGSSDYNTEPVVRDTSSSIRITARNLTIPQLYQVSLGRGRPIDWKHTLLDVKEPDKLIQFDKSGTEYLKSLEDGRGFCYEIVVPRSFGKRVYEMMTNDLRGIFPGYDARVEPLQTNSLVLRKTLDSTLSLLKSKGGDPSLYVDNVGVEMKNTSFNSFIARLNELHRPSAGVHRSNIFFFNETGFNDPVDLKIDVDLLDIDALNAELQKYGLLLEEEMRSIPMLVIRDKQ